MKKIFSFREQTAKFLKESGDLAEMPEVKALWTVTILFSLVSGWTFGTYVLFLISNGLSLFQVTLVNTIFMSVDTLFNPYTGRLADKYGQKRIYLLGQVMWTVGMLIYGLSHSFWGFAAAETTAAIGAALMSDALESWIRNIKGEEVAHRAIAKQSAFSTLATIPPAILGGIVGARFGLQWPWLLSALAGAIATMLAVKILGRFPESFEEGGNNPPSVRSVLADSFRIRPLRFAAIVMFMVAFCTQPFNMFWQPILKEASGETWWLGSLWIGIAVFSFLGAEWAQGQANGMGVVKMILLTAIPMALTPLFTKTTVPLVTLFLVHEAGRGAFRPILFTFANRHIPNNCRSTANSVRGSMKTLGAAAGLLTFGGMTKVLPPIAIWGVAAVGLIVLAVYARREVE